MPHPWEARVALPTQPSPTNERLRAMLAAGLTVVSTQDIDEGWRISGNRTIFTCGCERIYRVELLPAPARESEHIQVCDTHANDEWVARWTEIAETS